MFQRLRLRWVRHQRDSVTGAYSRAGIVGAVGDWTGWTGESLQETEAEGVTLLYAVAFVLSAFWQQFKATAYCSGQITASGRPVRPGVVAADREVIPLGSIVRLNFKADADRFDGVYQVLDIGPAVRGRVVDLYLADCKAAKRFERKDVLLRVVRSGWR